MTTTTQIQAGVVFEDHTAVIMAQVTDLDGELITQADVQSSGIVYTIYDLTAAAVVSGHSAAALTTANVVFDTPQTPDVWTLDDTGYNFRHVIGTTGFPLGDRKYQYTASITLTDGTKCIVPFLLDCEEVYSG